MTFPGCYQEVKEIVTLLWNTLLTIEKHIEQEYLLKKISVVSITYKTKFETSCSRSSLILYAYTLTHRSSTDIIFVWSKNSCNYEFITYSNQTYFYQLSSQFANLRYRNFLDRNQSPQDRPQTQILLSPFDVDGHGLK